MLYWEKELEMLSRLLKNFGMKDVEAVVDASSHDRDMATKKNKIFFLFDRKIAVGKGSKKLRLGMV